MIPLAERIRPQSLEEWIGHSDVFTPGSLLYDAIQNDRIFSFILYAPPGTGKSSLCLLIKKYSQSRVHLLSAVTSGVKDVKAAIDEAKAWKDRASKDTILFIDEIHHFNKAQQDSLLHAVERGDITLIGATTENPSYELNAALLSRLRVIRLEALKSEDLVCILRKGVKTLENDKGTPTVDDGALQLIAENSFGDARTALNLLELAFPKLTIDHISRLLKMKAIPHDKRGDLHYQVVSAFIKSMRASQTEAALYYLARLWEAGEDPTFIARRMVIFASEDIGNADIRALAVANAVRQSVEFVGRPECFYALSQGVLFLSKAPKSREAGDAFKKAMQRVERHGSARVPDFLINANTKLDRDLGRGRERRPDESFLPLDVD